jgi:hypothetical protein
MIDAHKINLSINLWASAGPAVVWRRVAVATSNSSNLYLGIIVLQFLYWLLVNLSVEKNLASILLKGEDICYNPHHHMLAVSENLFSTSRDGGGLSLSAWLALVSSWRGKPFLSNDIAFRAIRSQ